MKRTFILLATMLLPAIAAPQTPQPWDTNVIQWDAPARCSDGSTDMSKCTVTGYRVERTPVPGGSAATVVGTVGPSTLVFTHTGAAAGQNCYKVYALSAGGASAPSNELCKTNVAPQIAPGPPRNLREVAPTAAVPISR